MPRVRITRGRLLVSALFLVAIVAFLYFGLPKLVGFGHSLHELEHGEARWLIVAAIFELASFGGYIMLLRAVHAPDSPRINWSVSYQITMAGLAATRLFAAAGAGGLALVAWSLRRAGVEAHRVATRMVAFITILYGCYMAALLIGGLGLFVGLFPGPRPAAITLIPALFGALVIAIVLSISLLPGDFDRLVERLRSHPGVVSRIASRIASIPRAAASGVRDALALVRERKVGLLGAPAWWGFDVATLWASFHAFGAAPPVAVVIMAYFVGWLGNTLPLPGGVGGVEGGLIGAFSAFGVNVQSAVVAVLAYRMFSFWLPTLPGGVAYLQLRHTVARWRQEEAGAPSAPEAAIADSYTE
jgi:uncharacterized protein (TIRG00374 family)